jgi:hypothetical protein
MWSGRTGNGILLVMTVLLAAHSIAGCSIIRTAQTEPGANLERVQPGISRAELEGILGEPIRSWRSSLGVMYCLYEYDSGRPGSGTEAAAALLANLMTMGLFELIALIEPEAFYAHHRGRIIISFDENNMVLGAFGEFDELPPDGRPPR